MAEDIRTVNLRRLAEMWCHDEIGADTYFAEIDRRAPLAVEQMIREERAAKKSRRG